MKPQEFNDDEMMHQNNEVGPGWFLKIAYVIIALFCIYYFFEYKDWKSNYQLQQQEIQAKLGK